MQYLSVPRTITHADVVNRGMALSPSMYRRVEIPSRRTVEMRDLLAAWCNGEEVGSIAHVLKSPYRFIRTKAIQSESALSQFRGDAVGYIAPWAYYDAIAKEPC